MPERSRTEKDRIARRILGVPAGADVVEIKKAFWLEAMKHHPDRNPRDEDALVRFRNIVNAYELLAKNRAEGWNPDAPPGAGRIGDYDENEWGYFCWWRENFSSEERQEDDVPRRIHPPDRGDPDRRPGDWW